MDPLRAPVMPSTMYLPFILAKKAAKLSITGLWLAGVRFAWLVREATLH